MRIFQPFPLCERPVVELPWHMRRIHNQIIGNFKFALDIEKLIATRYAAGESATALGKEFQTSREHIQIIVQRRGGKLRPEPAFRKVRGPNRNPMRRRDK